MRRMLFVFVTMLAILFFPVVHVEAENETPVIYMLQSPAYNERKECMGIVAMPDGTACGNIKDYGVIFYIQVKDGDPYYVKPGDLDPAGHFKTIKPDEDGNFHGLYYSYGGGMINDLSAKYIHILLVPSDFSPSLNGYNSALSASFDHVTIVRETDGTVTVTPNRVPEADHSKRANLPVSRSKIAVNVGFYTFGRPGDEVSTGEMKRQLEAIRPFTDTVRFYSASGTVYKAYQLANSMGFSVIGNAWISGNTAEDKREMDALIEHANNGLIKMAVVGSETQYAGLVDMDTLLEDIAYVRDRLNVDIPVTTAETLGIIMGSARLRKACDVLFVNSYPIYENVSIENAVNHLGSQLHLLRTLGNGKQLIVSESGWATSGRTDATEANAVRYFMELQDWSLNNGIKVVFFEAFDEPWKSSQESEFGAHWGFMTKDLTLKPLFSALDFFQNAGFQMTISSIPKNTQRIEDLAFEECTELSYLYIPSTVLEIAETAFAGCPNLTIVAKKGSVAYIWALEHDMKVIGI